jgi:hypothetical protein
MLVGLIILLKVFWINAANCWMQLLTIIESFNPFRNGDFSCLSVAKCSGVDEFNFESVKKAL